MALRATAIPGLLVVDLVLHTDPRGWFKENWQREKMTALGLPDFGPVQHSIAANAERGVTRGCHAEPWDKLVSVGQGRVFGAWVDLRAGASFGTVVTLELGPETAVFVPRGVANSYQCLESDTIYSYLVNDHWSPEARARYSYVNVGDPALGIDWPIPLSDAILSEADRTHPRLAEATPVPARRTVILGGSGQLGRALSAALPDALVPDRATLDLTSTDSVEAFDWSDVGTIVNASAFTAVDACETSPGRRSAWATNVDGVARLCQVARERRCRLVQVSSDYVFDGEATVHDEDEPFSPLGVYGQTKAAGDRLVGQLPEHLVIRTSWLIGDGANFAETMLRLARAGAHPCVVDDQVGRLTFTQDLAAGIVHLLGIGAGGTFNLSNSGPAQTWAAIARDIFSFAGRDPGDVSAVSTAAWASSQNRPVAPRPRHSTLDLGRISSTGFKPPAAADRLRSWLDRNPAGPAT